MKTKPGEVASLLKQFEDLKKNREIFEDSWNEVTRLIYPRRSSWNINPLQNKRVIGEDIYDGTAIDALNLMADGVQGKLVTSSMPWFKLRFKQDKIAEETGAKEWLEEAEKAMYSIYNQANFYDAMGEVFPDGIAIGTGYLFIEGAANQIIFSPRHHMEMFISENSIGKVDSFARRYSCTYRQAEEFFGSDYPEKLRQQLKENPESYLTLIHMVKPRKTGTKGAILAKDKPFASYYFVYHTDAQGSDEDLISEGGYDDFPLVAWRFRKNPGEVYGRGPGLDAIYDVQMLNQSMKSLQEAGHRALRPPLVAHEMFRNRIQTNPGGVTYWDGQADPKIAQLGILGSFPLSLEVIQRQQKIVNSHFRAEFFSILAMERDRNNPGGQMTATEIAARTAETASIMGTIISRNQTELLIPTLNLTFVLGTDMGLIPRAPRNLLEKFGEYQIEPIFIGPLALAQRQFLTYQGTFEAGAAICQLSELLHDPTILFNFNWDSIARKGGESKGIAAVDIKPMAQVEKEKKQFAQAQAAQAQAQMQLEAAKVAPQGASNGQV